MVIASSGSAFRLSSENCQFDCCSFLLCISNKTDEKGQESSVHYYAGQTLRNVVKRCEWHCRNAKLLLDEATKDTYSNFKDYECVANMKNVILVDAYLAAAKAAAIKFSYISHNITRNCCLCRRIRRAL